MYFRRYEPKVPVWFKETIEQYIQNGIRPDGFTITLLENDLIEACIRADMINKKDMINMVKYIIKHVPPKAFGTPESVKMWIENKGLEGIIKKDEDVKFKK